MGIRTALVVALLVGSAASTTFADSRAYSGVVPGAVQTGVARPKKSAAKGTLAWIGFAAKEQGDELFFQAPNEIEVDQQVVGNELVVKLSGVQRITKGSARPLDTSFFNSPVARITAKQDGDNVVVRVRFKKNQQATKGSVHTDSDDQGNHFSYVRFGQNK